MSFRFAFRRCLMSLVAAGLVLFADATSAQQHFLAKGGQAEAVIVIGQDGETFDRWVAGELQRYLQKLCGAELPIAATDSVPPEKPLIVVGSPESNSLSASAQEKGLVSFAGLKPDGLVLKTVELSGAPALVVGGNDETGTMYAAYELLERLGIVFQLTGDIIPDEKPDLALPSLDVRMEPVVKYRGMHCCHGLRWYMGLEEFRKHIDQLAKLQMNCLQFYCGMGAPWCEFSYRGEIPEIIYSKESGYLAWNWGWHSTSGTAKDVRVGEECFPQDYLGPPEFAHVQTQPDAYATARAFLREVIRYAHRRKVEVWLTIGEIPSVPPSLVPPKTKQFMNRYCGTAIPYGHPAVLEIWEAALQSMIETYSEADAYGIWMAEHAIPTGDPETKALLGEYAHLRKLVLPAEEIHRQGCVHPRSPRELDSDFGQIAVVDKLIRRIRARHPSARLGVCMLFRGYLFRPLDAVLPKNVWLMNMENCLNTGPVMHFYGGVSGRELLAMPRIDDDGCELHIQVNAMLYDRDEIITGAARHGLAGIVGQLNKERGLECNARYMAEGAWHPDIECRSFYEGYLGCLYGPEVRDTVIEAYLILEENDEALGWQGRHGIFPGYRRFSPCNLRTNVDYRQPTLDVSRQQLERDIKTATGMQAFWRERAAHCHGALKLLRQAQDKVPPGSRSELEYVTFKTENLILYFQVLAAIQEAKAILDRAWLAKDAQKAPEYEKQLSLCRVVLERADRLARDAAQQMTSYCHVPTEKYLLFRYNQNVIQSIEQSRKYIAEVISFQKGQSQKGSHLSW
jgi:hypothetical protein